MIGSHKGAAHIKPKRMPWRCEDGRVFTEGERGDEEQAMMDVHRLWVHFTADHASKQHMFTQDKPNLPLVVDGGKWIQLHSSTCFAMMHDTFCGVLFLPSMLVVKRRREFGPNSHGPVIMLEKGRQYGNIFAM